MERARRYPLRVPPTSSAPKRDSRAVSRKNTVADSKPQALPGSVRVWQPEGLEGVELQYVDRSRWPLPKMLLAEHQVTLGAQGRGTLLYQGKEVAFSSTFLGTYQAGEVLSGVPNGTWTHMTLRFTSAFLEAAGAGVAPLPSTYPEGCKETLRTLWLAAFMSCARPATRVERESRLFEAISQLFRYANKCSPTPDRREHAAVFRAKRYLDAYFLQNLSLADLAHEARLSRFYLLRVFQEAIGVSPHEYQTCLRIHYAKRLLNCGYPLATVALDTGFSDQAHLTRKFKGLVGVTPGQYRRNRESANS